MTISSTTQYTTLPSTGPTSDNNTNSLYNKYSRLVGGGVTEVSDGMLGWWERSIYAKDPSDQVYVVENYCAQRIDKISVVFYGEARWGWLIAQYNNILDPFTELTPGRYLLIPTKARLPLLIATQQGGVDSTAQPVATISPIIT
jgi:hypothetical protein